MKNGKIILIVVSAIAVLTAVYMLKPSKKHEEVKVQPVQQAEVTHETIPGGDEVIATYGSGEKVTKGEITAKLKSVFGGSLPDGKADFNELPTEIKQEFTKSYILNKMVLADAKAANLESTSEFQVQIAETTNQLLQKIYLDQMVKKQVSEDKIKAAYDEMAAKTSQMDEVHAAHILVATEKEANDILAQIKAGKSFEELAKTKSLDNNKDRGGDLDYFSKGQMVKEFEDVAFSLNPGEISNPVKTDFGWHIIKLLDKRKKQPLTYDQAKGSLTAELGQKVVKGYVDGLVAKANIQFNVTATPTQAAPVTPMAPEAPVDPSAPTAPAGE